jgi:proteasome lid subunit RPN8/RPN11
MSDLVVSLSTRELICAHARAEYPKECCGLLFNDDSYLPCFNFAENPLEDFKISTEVYKTALLDASKKIAAVVHSHPNKQRFPSANDMRGQMDTAVPWIIVPLDGETVMSFTQWGDQLPTAPILGREFLHGVHDCYSLIRDTFGLGRDELAKQGIDWPFPPIKLRDYARDDAWWVGAEADPSKNLYMTNFDKAGFVEISPSEAAPGDMFYIKVMSKQVNHGGLLVGGGLLLHHLPVRLSRREPARIWLRNVDKWLRYKGPGSIY